VGRPRTNGFSGVGAKVLMRSVVLPLAEAGAGVQGGALRTNDVVGNVPGCVRRIVAND
jgi:hypothetical protein